MCEIPVVVLCMCTCEDGDAFLFGSVLDIARASKYAIKGLICFLQFGNWFVRFSVNGIDNVFGVCVIDICCNANVNVFFWLWDLRWSKVVRCWSQFIFPILAQRGARLP